MIHKCNFHAIGQEAFNASFDMVSFVAGGNNREDIHVLKSAVKQFLAV